MLLLGVFAAALIVAFDFWFHNERTLSFIILRKLKETEIPLVWLISISGLTLTASGFFFYIISFFLLAAPAFYFREKIQRKKVAEAELFRVIGNQALARFIPSDIAELQSRKFLDGFMYLLLTASDSQIASAARFSFTQLMFARSLAPIFVLFSWYVCHVNSVSVFATIVVVSGFWIVLCFLYMRGLIFYESVMTSGVIIERLHQNKPTARLKNKSNSAVNMDIAR